MRLNRHHFKMRTSITRPGFPQLLLLLCFLSSPAVLLAQLDVSRGMCNFNPCVQSPVAAQCVVDVAVVGVATCKCPEGFAGDGKPPEQGGTGCQNIDECASRLDTCDKTSQICVDKDPLYSKGVKYECSCKQGFAPSANGKSCEDIDECVQSQLNMCDAHSTICRNFAGGYECICKDPNQVFDSRLNACRDIDECNDFDGKRNPCDPNSTVCVNQPNGVSCQCKSGFEPVAGTPTMCIDIDECALELDECQRDRSVCRNVIGDYECQCSQERGFENLPDNRKLCGNLNECQKWPHICGPSTPCCADLAPEMGGYSCAPAVPTGGVSYDYSSQPPLPNIRQQETVPMPYGHAALLPRGLSDMNVKGTVSSDMESASERRLQISSRIPSLRTQPMPGNSANIFRRPETSVCPAGYQHVEEIARNQARQKTAEVFRTTFAGASRANPEKVASGIATNAGLIANEFATWYNSLSNLPTQVAYASQNATSINYMAGASNAVKAGEAMVVPFASSAASGMPNVAASQMGLGGSAIGSAAQQAISNPALVAGAGALAGGVVVGAATAGGPSESFVMDRSGLGRLMAYDQF